MACNRRRLSVQINPDRLGDGLAMTRRDWISTIGIGAAVAVPAYAAEKPVRCTVLDDRGAPVPVEALARFYICDLLLRPSPIDPKFAPGEAVFDPIGKPFRISVPLRVPGFAMFFFTRTTAAPVIPARRWRGTTVCC